MLVISRFHERQGVRVNLLPGLPRTEKVILVPDAILKLITVSSGKPAGFTVKLKLIAVVKFASSFLQFVQ